MQNLQSFLDDCIISDYTDESIAAALPHETPRGGQVAAIKFALDNFKQGKRFVFLEAPTGAGKSAIAVALAKFFQRSYYLTIQKILQNQIMRDYGTADGNLDTMVELKGRNAYPCTFYELFGTNLVSAGKMREKTLNKQLDYKPNCDQGYCKRRLLKHKCESCFPANELEMAEWTTRYGVSFSTCPYYEQVEHAVRARNVLMNFSSFLFQTQFTDRFGSRPLMIIDECHHCESQLMDFVDLTIASTQLNGTPVPEYDDPVAYAVWLHDIGAIDILAQEIQEARDREDFKKEDELTKIYYKFNRFMKCIDDGMTDWVCDHKTTKMPDGKTIQTVILKPVFVHHFANPLLFRYGQRILMMSATILNAGIMCKALGISVNDVAFYRIGSSFPVENRPIFIRPVAKATGGAAGMREWGPKLADAVDKIAAAYPQERGIVHTHNFAISELFMERCASKGRFLFQRNFESKEEMLAKHADTPNAIIVAPAMHEGLDLRDDLSRFQIICKTPYPNFFDDKQLAVRKDLDYRYLQWMVALKLVQSYGRSVRSKEDWAHTYIIDSAVIKFLKEAKGLMPQWFKDAVVEGKSNDQRAAI